MKIGILQTGQAPDELRPEHGDYPDLFETLLADQGLTFRTWHVEEMEFPDSVDDAEGWLITGSRHGAYEDHPFIAPLERFIRKAYDADVPVVGICFGHQIIAQAMGGKVEKHGNGWAVGRQVYDWKGKKVALNAWHQDQVTVVPDTAEICATNEFCTNAALLYGKRAFSVQAHPEFTSAFIEGLMRTRGKGRVPEAQMEAAAQTLDQPNDRNLLARQIAGFFKERQIA